MTEKKVWLVTGAGRGLGVHIARAVLASGRPAWRPASPDNPIPTSETYPAGCF